jgi:hypothetical protein
MSNIVEPFVPPSFGTKIDSLLAPARLNELGPGQPNLAMRDKLDALSAGGLLENVGDPGMASACLAGIWLYHDFLDESHSLSQEIDTPEGSYWHGILHRREPDYANAKYWLRRVGGHPTDGDLAVAAGELAQAAPIDSASRFLIGQPSWDRGRFVDLCQAAMSGPSAVGMLCRKIQQREWWLLFKYCYERACSTAKSVQ